VSTKKLKPRDVRKVRRAKRMALVTSINLVSMIDIFTILIIYLLVNTAAVQIVGAEQVDLPKSLALEPPRETVSVIISAEDILVDGEAVMKVSDAKTSRSLVLDVLKEKLLAESPPPAAPVAEGAQPPEAGEVNILADKSIPYSLLKKVMTTCTAAQFGKISLGVIPKAGGGGAAPP